jgi:Fe-S-cluster containining protein
VLDEGAGASGEWFDRPDRDTGDVGLRFGCTMCGNCCSGPPGFVLFTEAEGRAMAARLGISEEEFLVAYTGDTAHGRSLLEVNGEHGLDCVFLDRTSVPGKAVCGVYEDRPAQCKAWPFWDELLRSRDHWVRAKRGCPGLDSGRLYTPVEIRVIRGGGGS